MILHRYNRGCRASNPYFRPRRTKFKKSESPTPSGATRAARVRPLHLISFPELSTQAFFSLNCLAEAPHPVLGKGAYGDVPVLRGRFSNFPPPHRADFRGLPPDLCSRQGSVDGPRRAIFSFVRSSVPLALRRGDVSLRVEATSTTSWRCSLVNSLGFWPFGDVVKVLVLMVYSVDSALRGSSYTSRLAAVQISTAFHNFLPRTLHAGLLQFELFSGGPNNDRQRSWR